MMNQLIKKYLLLLILLSISHAALCTSDESYIQSLSGKIKKGDSCTVIDDKFLSLPLTEWNRIQNLTVENLITFELRQDTTFFFYNKTFTCTLNVSIKYFTTRDQHKPAEINNINLVIKYDTASGKFYPVFDRYTFKNAFKVTVVVNSIESPEWGNQLPAIFCLKNQIVIQRKYPFLPFVKGVLQFNTTQDFTTTQVVNNQLHISWNTADFPGAEEYDVEWTFVDVLSERGREIIYSTVGSPPTVPPYNGPFNNTDAKVEEWMRYDNSRVTVKASSYIINLPYTNGFIIARVRGAAFNHVTNIRETTSWQFRNSQENLSITYVDFHEAGLNWQYTASFAEEGKRKEIITYFDGSMRNRQSVTISNSELTLVEGSTTDRKETAIVQETIYDNMGRPTVNILPAPIRNNKLSYYYAINKNTAGNPYSYTDITPDANGINCTVTAAPLNAISGAAQYYSPQNNFINDPYYYFNQYIPDAAGYPFTTTAYTPDNTGRIRRQGGVGNIFKIEGNHATQYFYGKPLQQELYRIFGMEVGNASHYLKNMVIDPNGQISISYLNATGKTIATALAGQAPANLDELPSAQNSEAKTNISQVLIRPSDFQIDAGNLTKQATATFLAAVIGPYEIPYSVSPAVFGPWNGPTLGMQFCSNCYYDIEITIKDDCGNIKATTHTPAFLMNDTACHANAQPFTGVLPVTVEKFGEHTVTYTLRLSEDVIKYQTDYYIRNNIDLKKLQNFFEEELNLTDLKGCYSDCDACKNLPNLNDFIVKMKALLLKLQIEKYPSDKYPDFDINSPFINNWITNTYNDIVQNCAAVANNCITSPCEQKLEMMKNDVRPGGQYTMYDSASYTIPASEATVSIVYNSNGSTLHYKDDPQITNFEFTDEDGIVRHIKDADVTESMFIKAYLIHPEWANDFVKRHIEYCSYLWCKDATNPTPTFNNEASYTFDEKLREQIDGTDALSLGYYNRNDYLALLNKDPFFNGGRGTGNYKTAMQNDLAALSEKVNIRFKDQNGSYLSAKNILQLVEWLLYCKPADESAPSTTYITSWNNCNPENNCRSIDSEWELYRNYYLKLKNKYVRLAKLAFNSNCENCFIGQDAYTANTCLDPGPVSDYSFIALPRTGRIAPYKFVYKNETAAFNGNYKVIYSYQDDCGVHEVSFTTTRGDSSVVITPVGCTDRFWNVRIISIACMEGNLPSDCNSGNEVPGPCPTTADFEYDNILIRNNNVITPTNEYYDYQEDVYYKLRTGVAGRNINITVNTSTLNCNGPATPDPCDGGSSTHIVTLLQGQNKVFLGSNIMSGSIDYPYMGDQVYHGYHTENVNVNSIDCTSNNPVCPTSSDFRNEIVMLYDNSTTAGVEENIDRSYEIYYVHNGGPVTQAVSIRLQRQYTYFYIDPFRYCDGYLRDVVLAPVEITLNPGQDRIYLGTTTEYYSLNLQTGCYNYFNEVTYYSGSVIDCPNNNPVCPTAADFHIETDDSYQEDIEICSTGTQLPQTYINEGHNLYYVHNNGPVNRPIEIRVKQDTESWIPVGQHNGAIFHFVYRNTFYSWRTLSPGQQRLFVGNNNTTYSETDLGPPWGCTFTYSRSDYSVVPNEINCPPYEPPPSNPPSTCVNDPRAAWYTNKIRIFNEYLDEEGYQNCLIENVPVTQAQIDSILAASIAARRLQAIAELDILKNNWLNKLRAIIAEENEADSLQNIPPRFASLADQSNGTPHPTLQNLVNNLYLIAKKYIEIAPEENIRPASTLPADTVAANGYNNFTAVFTNIIGPALMQKGFGPHLLDQPYPYDKTPFTTSPNINEVSPSICANIDTLRDRWQAANTAISFYTYLQQQLKDDFVLSPAEFADLEGRCANNCRLLNEPLKIPVAFAAPFPPNPDHPWVDCNKINTLNSNFLNSYPDVVIDTKLYRLLLTNYFNQQLGYALSYEDYEEFIKTTCIADPTAVLYNKPASPLINYDHTMICVENILRKVFNKAGEEYEWYIETERIKFRNAYISKCLSTPASAKLKGEQYEYHYTLYYYDQSGNLVKTIPPEGVKLLTDQQIEQVEIFIDDDPTICTGEGIPATENQLATFTAFSQGLQSSSNATKAVEMWLYSSTGSLDRQLRIITPDKKYMYQVAISDEKIWAELYTLDPLDSISLTLSSSAVANLVNLPLQQWTHVMIQSPDSLTGGTLQLYVDGRRLTNIATAMEPGYPFDWEIASTPESYTLPEQDISLLKHMRMYNRVATDAEIWANYRNSCLSPVDALAINGMPLQYWGRFNIPLPGSETTTGPGSTVEYINRFFVPDHTLPTTYAYNSLNQVIKQNTPDAGISEFFYDRLGRLTVSQNAEQKNPAIVDAENPSNRYSYTKYDALGRIIEVGEKLNATSVTEIQVRDTVFLQNWLSSGNNRQVTVTAYDQAPVWTPAPLAGLQHNLRKRVVASALLRMASPVTNPSQNRTAASYYSYDIIGNVNKQVQENKELIAAEATHINGSNGLKEIKYEYDLVSGKVNKVLYQDGKWDQFYYQYLYDADNRVVSALSSRINYPGPELWINEATYRYYLHGPLARMELGQQKVQGTDYAYTLQGWLKGVNSQQLTTTGNGADMNADGHQAGTGAFGNVGRDALGFSLGYYDNDYTPIGGVNAKAFNILYQSPQTAPGTESGKQLFNGNIRHATYAIRQLENGNMAGYTYRYDQLNRLTAMNRHSISTNATNWSNNSIIDAYKESISYDANGNIKTYLRNGSATTPAMDNMTYGYNVDSRGRLVNNRLRHVKDNVAATNYTEDIDDQYDDNYSYDKIGNLITDNAENIQRINWTVYGKIGSITKTGTNIQYGYDASGNRITKKVSAAENTSSYYVRDAQGNVLALYQLNNSSLNWAEQHLYGSSRLGMATPGFSIPSSQPLPNDGYNSSNDSMNNGIQGKRMYELSNHLGNVLVTVSDKKIGIDTDSDGYIDYYNPDVVTATDYYPFGQQMSGRIFRANGTYRYGFNGKENDNEISGDGNKLDFGARIYDSRLGRWLSVDPLQSKYPDMSPYIAFNNNPIFWVDPDGRDIYPNGIKNTAYWDTYQSLLTNPTAKSLLQKFENNKNFNLTLREGTFPVTSVTDAHHGVSSRQVHRSTGKVASQNSFIEFNLKRTKIELTRTFNGVEYNYTRTMTDFYKFSSTLHELIHAKIGYADSKQKDLEAGNNHNYFANNYFNTLVKGLTEYAKSNNLDLTEQEIKETAFVGLRKTDLFKKYIKGLADNNKTTVEQEEEAYEKRINVITWKTTAVKASDNTLVIDGAESDKFNVKKEK